MSSRLHEHQTLNELVDGDAWIGTYILEITSSFMCIAFQRPQVYISKGFRLMKNTTNLGGEFA